MAKIEAKDKTKKSIRKLHKEPKKSCSSCEKTLSEPTKNNCMRNQNKILEEKFRERHGIASTHKTCKNAKKCDCKTEKAITKHDAALLAAANPKMHHHKHSAASKNMASSLDSVVKSIQEASTLFKQ